MQGRSQKVYFFFYIKFEDGKRYSFRFLRLFFFQYIPWAEKERVNQKSITN